MYGNLDAALLWLSILAKYLINKWNMTRIQAGSWIFDNKYDEVKLELVMSIHVDDVFMEGGPETLENLK